MKISISDLDLYIHCPRAYKLHCIDGIKPSHKSLSLCKAITVQKVILNLHQHSLKDLSDEQVKKICEEIWQKEVSEPEVNQAELTEIVVQAKPETKNHPFIPDVTKKQRLLEEIQTWLSNYAKLEQESQVLYSDIWFEDEIGDIVFTSHIDQIRKHPKEGLQLLLFKTSSQAPSLEYLSRDFHISLIAHASWQGKLHSLCPEIKSNTVPVIYCYYFPHLGLYKRNGKHDKGSLKGDPLIPVYRTENTLLQFEYEILRVVAGIELEFFPMRVTNPVGCNLCAYSYQCKNAASEQASENVYEYQSLE